MKYIIIVFVFLTLNSWAQKEGIVRINIAKEYKSQNLSYLKNVVGNAQIVMLGEPSHGEGNILELKTQMVKYLVEEMGFEVIAFESPMYDLYKLNHREIIKEDINNAIFPIWTKTKEFQSFVDWSYAHKNKLTFAGFDCQVTEEGINDFIVDIQDFNYKLTKEDLVYLENELEILYSREKEINDHARFSKILDRIIKTTQLKKKAENALVIRQMCKSLKTYAHYILTTKPHLKTKETFKAKDNNGRDKQMALNLLFLQKYYNKKIICWGANAHFAYNFKSFDEPELWEFIPMGYYIKKKLKNKVLNIGFTTYQGQYLNHKFKPITISTKDTSTYEHQLAKTHTHALIDIRDIKDTLALQNYCDYTKFKGVYSQAMDFIFFSKDCTLPTIRTYRKKKEIQGVVLDQENHPIPFANIYSSKRSEYGGISDAIGRFSFQIPEEIQRDSLLISSVGFHLKAYVSSGKIDTIICKKDAYSLQEIKIKVKAISAKSILRKAIEQIKNNYNIEPYNRRCYTKSTTLNYKDTIDLYELINEVSFKKGIINRKSNYKTIQYNEIKEDKEYWGWGGSLNYIGNFDLLNPKIFKKHKMNINPKKTTSDFYVLNFQYKGKQKYSLCYPKGEIRGEITINKKDFAITDIKIFRNFDCKKYNRIIKGTSNHKYKRRRNAMRDSRSSEAHYIFNKINGKYYNTFASFNHIEKGYFLFSNEKYEIKSNIQSILMAVKPYKKIIKNKESFFKTKHLYKNPKFWAHYKRPIEN